MSKAAFITSVSTPHDGYISSIVSKGSSTVFIEGKAAARIGDKLDCNSFIMSGASTVNIS